MFRRERQRPRAARDGAGEPPRPARQRSAAAARPGRTAPRRPATRDAAAARSSAASAEVAGVAARGRGSRRRRRPRRRPCRAVSNASGRRQPAPGSQRATSTRISAGKRRRTRRHVEPREREAPRRRARAADDPRDQVARDDEEDVDADEAAPHRREGVEGDDGERWRWRAGRRCRADSRAGAACSPRKHRQRAPATIKNSPPSVYRGAMQLLEREGDPDPAP